MFESRKKRVKDIIKRLVVKAFRRDGKGNLIIEGEEKKKKSRVKELSE